MEVFGFSKAHDLLLQGYDLMRKGWNGKNQFVTLLSLEGTMYRQWEMQDCLALKNSQDVIQPGWVPSQGDMLAEDWMIYEAKKDPEMEPIGTAWVLCNKRPFYSVKKLKNGLVEICLGDFNSVTVPLTDIIECNLYLRRD